MWRNTTWNLLGMVIPSLIAIPAMAFMARILGIEKFGLFMLAFSVVGYAGIFDGGLTRAVIRAVAMHDDRQKHRLVIGTASWAVMALSAIACLLVYMFSSQLVSLLNVTAESAFDTKAAFQLLAFVIPPFLLGLIWFAYPEGRQDFVKLNIYKTFNGTLVALLPVLAILYIPTLTGAILGLLVGRVLGLGLAFIPCWQGLGTKFFVFNIRTLQELLSFGGWITFSNIVSPLMAYADRFLLSNLVGAQRVAFYTAPSEAIARMSIVPGAVSRTIFPLFSKLQGEAGSTASRAHKALLLVSLLMALSVFLLAPQILELWLGKPYGHESSAILRVLLVGFVFNAIAQIPFSHIQAQGKARITAMVHLAELLPYLSVFALLVYFYGLFGAAMAWTLRVAADFFILQYFSHRLEN